MAETHGINPYLRTKVMTAGPDELRLMLFDGAIKFATQAHTAMKAGRIEQTYHNLTRSKKIVLELSNTLNHKESPELCEKLAAIYTYIYRLLVDANFNREPQKIDEALDLLRYERETWRMLMQKIGEAPSAEAHAAEADQPISINPAGPATRYARSA